MTAGRPEKANKRTRRIPVPVTDDEGAEINAGAAAIGLDSAAYLRMAGLERCRGVVINNYKPTAVEAEPVNNIYKDEAVPKVEPPKAVNNNHSKLPAATEPVINIHKPLADPAKDAAFAALKGTLPAGIVVDAQIVDDPDDYQEPDDSFVVNKPCPKCRKREPGLRITEDPLDGQQFECLGCGAKGTVPQE